VCVEKRRQHRFAEGIAQTHIDIKPDRLITAATGKYIAGLTGTQNRGELSPETGGLAPRRMRPGVETVNLSEAPDKLRVRFGFHSINQQRGDTHFLCSKTDRTKHPASAGGKLAPKIKYPFSCRRLLMMMRTPDSSMRPLETLGVILILRFRSAVYKRAG
jgi:hypothetical protein